MNFSTKKQEQRMIRKDGVKFREGGKMLGLSPKNCP